MGIAMVWYYFGVQSSAELYELLGPTFRLPVYVRLEGSPNWSKDCVSVSATRISLMQCQKRVLEQTMHDLMERRRDESWIVSREVLEDRFRKSVHTEPEEVVVWNWSDPMPNTASGFIAEYCRNRDAVLHDRGQAAILWSSMCRFAMRWMLERNRKLDLGFCVISAAPLRRNWVDILIQRWMQTSSNKNFTDKVFCDRYITSKILTATDDAGLIKWSLNVEPSKSFNEAAKAIEKQRHSKRSDLYFTKIRNLVDAHRNRIYEIFKACVAEKNAPTAPIPRRKRGRPRSNGIATVDDTVEPIEADSGNALHGGDGVAGVLEKGAAESLASADASVHEVPALLQGTDDVRRPNQEREVGEAGNGHAGIARMSLLSAVEK